MSQNISKSTLLLFLAGLVASITFAYVYTNSKITQPGGNSTKTDTLYRRVIEKKEINAAYYVGEPYFIKNPNSDQVSGIFPEVLELATKNLGLKINWTTEVGFPDMAAGLETGKYDIVGSGIWINSSRAKQTDFSIPVLYDVVGVYVRTDDKRFDSDLNRINDPNVIISTIDGEMAQTIAKENFPNAKTFSLPPASDFSLMLKNVVDKKADVTFLGLGAANNFIQNNPKSLRNITQNQPIRVFPTAVMVKRGEYEFTQMLNFALLELINNGEVERIIKKYEKYSNSHYRVRQSFASPSN